ILYVDNTREALELRADAIDTVNTHGTGCTLSSAIASFMALGYDLKGAVRQAKFYVTKAIEAGAFVKTGTGAGPLNHFFSPRRLKNYNPQTH
ncbi:MAG: hydroxymethylpyrimidine/phosphomethylpyrimidine kinase, partial [Duncaniella sp.]|nr:hydroxymethylpyrimidine/phosphomethylpyrimidine kinase [Duncaniella sp.]